MAFRNNNNNKVQLRVGWLVGESVHRPTKGQVYERTTLLGWLALNQVRAILLTKLNCFIQS